MLADRYSTIAEIQSHFGPAPKDWMNQLDDAERERVKKVILRSMDLDRYLRLTYDQDDDALFEMEEDEIPVEEYEKAKRDLTDAELDALSTMLSNLLTYDPTLRGTPDMLLRSPWFKGQGEK